MMCCGRNMAGGLGEGCMAPAKQRKSNEIVEQCDSKSVSSMFE